MIELFVFPPSPRAFKPMAVANHLGLDWTLRRVDLVNGEQNSAEFAALNPNRRMPVVKDGDYILWESNAIMQYLAGRRPESGLLPADERGRLDVTRWQFWDVAHWDPTTTIFLVENLLKPVILKSGEPDAAAIAKGTETFHRLAAVLDQELTRHEFVAGDGLTVADFSLGAPLNLGALGRFPLEPYAAIKRWHQALCALPSWQQTLQQCAFPAAAAA